MTKKIKENIEIPRDCIEDFELLISEYCKVFLDARDIMEKEKMYSGGVISLERLLEIFSEFNLKKQNVISTFFELDSEKQDRVKNVELSNIFNRASGPEKRAIGEIKAGIENNLTNKI